MAFKKDPPKPAIPKNPDELLRDLPRRKIPDVTASAFNAFMDTHGLDFPRKASEH
jgi:hypothetical protein